MRMTNRTIISRPPRRPQFSLEALQLFAKLETIVEQDSHEFKVGSKKLAALLGLGAEFLCSGASVNDKSAEPPWPPNYPASQDFWRVRAVRHQLLAAVGAQQNRTTTHDRRESNHTRTDRVRTAQDAADHAITLAAATRRARL